MPPYTEEERKCLMEQHIHPGPGPAAYCLPPMIGNICDGLCQPPNKPTAPAWTMRPRYCEKENDDCGPPFYCIPSSIGACGPCGVPDKKSSPQWTMAGRFCESDADCGSPGPAAYCLPPMIANVCETGLCNPPNKPTAPAWTIKGRPCIKENEDCGGPFYCIPSTIGACGPCGAPDKKSSPQWTMAGRPCESDADCGSPGPAAYCLPSMLGNICEGLCQPPNKPTAPAWTIKGRPCVKENEDCGAPFYCIPSTIGAGICDCGVPDKKTSPRHSFGVRHTDFKYNYDGASYRNRNCEREPNFC